MLTKKQRIYKLIKRVRLWISGQKSQAYPVFVFGCHRSGTNMLMNVLNRSGQVECYHENDEEAQVVRLRDYTTISRLIKKSFAKVVTFKPATESQNATKILNAHQGSKGIWIYRRYQDVTNSSLRNFKEHYKYLHYMLFEPERADWRIENVSPEDMKLVEKYYNKKVSDASARTLIWYLRNHLYFQQNLGDKDERVLLVNYERLVSNPHLQFKRIFDFIGARYIERFANSVFSTSINKSPFPEIDSEIQALCDEMYENLESVLEQQQKLK